MDLPGMRTIPVLHGNGFARLWASPCWHRNGLARTDSVLAYGHCGWLPMASTAHLYDQRGSMLARDGQRDKVHGKIIPALKAML